MKKIFTLFLLCFLMPVFAYASTYTVTVTTDKATYARSGVVKTTALFKRSGSLSSPSSTPSITIKNPSGSKVVDAKSMSKISTGTYTYSYTLSSSATYGTYTDTCSVSGSDTGSGSVLFAVAAADIIAPVTTATPVAGTYAAAQNVSLSANEPATVYYTTNGTTPTTSSAVYSTAIPVATTTTLKYFARDTAGNSAAVKTDIYTITTNKVHPTMTWTGYNMCRSCHVQQTTDMFNSVHYQWRGPSATTTGPATQGKYSPTVDNSTAMNSYCINILGNWNSYSGCSNCHVGLGVQPTTTADATQLDNIDCLFCHQKDYKRTRPITGGLYVPNTALMSITMDQAVQTVSKPTRANCLQCHAKGGGGDNVKRGDMALAQGATTDDTFDVHMATTRGNLPCQTCHTTASHKMAGRGTDLRPKEASAIIGCSNTACHPTKAGLTSGHSTSDVNHHTGRVACQACHIKTYAKNAADTTATEMTETHRTWKTPTFSATLNRYEPTMTFAGNLTPLYAFWNGTSWGSNMLDTPVLDPATGAYKLSRPNGAINDAVGTKLYPFKYKTSEAPLNIGRNKLISVDTSVYFTSNNVDGAINQGMVNMGFSAGEPYSWVKTDEYQLITHEVAKATGNVLACADCHGTTTRINLPAMGYALKGAQSTICAQCHGVKSNPGFTSVHSKHVASNGYDCSFCHSFTRATERSLKTTR